MKRKADLVYRKLIPAVLKKIAARYSVRKPILQNLSLAGSAEPLIAQAACHFEYVKLFTTSVGIVLEAPCLTLDIINVGNLLNCNRSLAKGYSSTSSRRRDNWVFAISSIRQAAPLLQKLKETSSSAGWFFVP